MEAAICARSWTEFPSGEKAPGLTSALVRFGRPLIRSMGEEMAIAEAIVVTLSGTDVSRNQNAMEDAAGTKENCTRLKTASACFSQFRSGPVTGA